MTQRDHNSKLHILLAEDDSDDRFFFMYALKAISRDAHLTTVEDGEKLMSFLSENSEKLPDILFLDLNMPRKNGNECLKLIKNDRELQNLPVIILSTCHPEGIADELHQIGAHYYIRKTDLLHFKNILDNLFTLMDDEKFVNPPRENFVLRNVNTTPG